MGRGGRGAHSETAAPAMDSLPTTYLSSCKDSTEEVDESQQQHWGQAVCILQALCHQRGQDSVTKAAGLWPADCSETVVSWHGVGAGQVRDPT